MTTPDLKPLYLEGSRELRVELDGPGLRIRHPGHAERRFPLRRLSRLQIGGNVQLEADALQACLRRNVVVSFIDQHGHLAGLCMGNRVPQTDLAARLRDFGGYPQWRAYYANWYRAMERQAILSLVRRLTLAPADLRPDTVRGLYSKKLATLTRGKVDRHAINYLDALACSYAAEMLGHRGVAPGCLIDEQSGHQLVRDMGRLLGWELRVLAFRRISKRRKHLPLSRAELARHFETRTAQFENVLAHYLQQLDDLITSLHYQPPSRSEIP